ncbi:cytochrome c3 family protein [Geopsychrobacter electrodiphilus]|uniref:cytochrome c3 family protein n=1 Tax=Geopsychrobacter electrodiphilus TaxID=225196 RepID=UPI0003814E8D|nr:cytochrome c3 family protein [Geopsychrobacter electrodiphilus]
MLRLLLLLFLLIPAPLLASDQTGPEAVEYPSRWGVVTFKHLSHQQRLGNCRICHHQGVEMGSCASCHGVIKGLPQLKDVLHKQCVNCHWQQHGPTECAGCHDPERLDESVYKD